MIFAKTAGYLALGVVVGALCKELGISLIPTMILAGLSGLLVNLYIER